MTGQLNQRIRRCAERAGSGEALARRSGIPRRTLETYLSGQAEPKASRLTAIARAVGVSVHWLATGEGPMSPTDPFPEPGELVPVPLLGENGPTDGVREDPPPYGTEPLALGHALVEALGLQDRKLWGYRVTGDAMAPTLTPGDLVVIAELPEARRHRLPPGEGIYLVRLSGRLHLKRLQDDGLGGLLVKSDNPSYETLHLEAADLDKMEILGRAAWYGRALP